MSVYHLLTTVNEASSTPEEGQKGTKMLLGRMGGLAVLALLALGGPALAQMPGYQIVGQDESDIKNRLLSIQAPLARALINKSVGDSVEVSTPGGSKLYEIVSVEFR